MRSDQGSFRSWPSCSLFIFAIAAVCSLQACGGSSASSKLFAYVANPKDSTISGYGINANGVLVPLAISPILTAGGPFAVAADPQGRHLYVGDNDLDRVVAYSIDPQTGALEDIGVSQFGPPGIGPGAIAIHPSGKWLYTAGPGAALYGFAIDDTGRLSALAGSPFANLGALGTGGIAIDPLGKFVFVSNSISENVSVFSVNSATGQLTQVGTPTPSGNAQWVTTDASGEHLYVPSAFGNEIFVFAIGAAGVLTPLSPPTYTVSGEALYVALSPNGRFLYVPTTDPDAISVFSIDATTGALAAIVGSPFATGTEPGSIAFTPSEEFAYVPSQGTGMVWEYPANPATGALGAPSQVAAGKLSSRIAVVTTHP